MVTFSLDLREVVVKEAIKCGNITRIASKYKISRKSVSRWVA